MPPCSRMASSDRTRCCRYPIRPVTPFSATCMTFCTVDQPSASGGLVLGKGFPENRLGRTGGQARGGPVADARPSDMARHRVTLQDVADRAEGSLTTASRVINGGARPVGKELADRVHKAVAELGYTANLQARAVATGQSTMIGVALRDISDPYFSSIAAGLIEAADARRLLVCMTSTAAHEVAEREYVALMRAQRARAVVLVGSRSDNIAARDALRAELAAFTQSGGRAACIGQDMLGVDTVLPENRASADALARALA